MKKSADNSSIPIWLVNNLAIDLRNIQNEKESTKLSVEKNSGQEYIDNSKSQFISVVR